MISLSIKSGHLVIALRASHFAPRHDNQLSYWGFSFDSALKEYTSKADVSAALAVKIVKYLSESDCVYEITEQVSGLLKEQGSAERLLACALEQGRRFKDGKSSHEEERAFVDFLRKNVKRRLKQHQIKAALHLLSVGNGANFSVPGSGKTTVVLAVFHYLRSLGEVDALFVVGPPASFGPWRVEYAEVLGIEPDVEMLAGGDIDDRHSKYQVNKKSVCDLYLTSFQTLQHDWDQVRILFKHQDIKFYYVIDEAHYVKQVDGAWANAVLMVSQHASRRCILTGTPFPRSYVDAFNLFDVLWPQSPPITATNKHRIEYSIQQNKLHDAASILESTVSPLFYRVRKADLKLAPQVFHEPIVVPMNKFERLIYDTIINKIKDVSRHEYFRDIDLLLRLRRGRMIRLRQCVSFAGLISSAVGEYSENLFENNQSLADVIRNYTKLEKPAKLTRLINIIQQLLSRREKVVIWSNFVGTLTLIHDTFRSMGLDARLIYGNTPIQKTSISEELTREGIIKAFVRPDSGVDILVANPAACAESISLHKTCSNAVYYDLSYNCAQYLQSLDRIHRVGGSERKPSHYFFLQYANSLDQDILANLQVKATRMQSVIDRDYAVYSMDMFSDDEDEEAYVRLFGNAN